MALLAISKGVMCAAGAIVLFGWLAVWIAENWNDSQ